MSEYFWAHGVPPRISWSTGVMEAFFSARVIIIFVQKFIAKEETFTHKIYFSYFSVAVMELENLFLVFWSLQKCLHTLSIVTKWGHRTSVYFHAAAEHWMSIELGFFSIPLRSHLTFPWIILQRGLSINQRISGLSWILKVPRQYVLALPIYSNLTLLESVLLSIVTNNQCQSKSILKSICPCANMWQHALA